jgi:very-short-patch-repair endonuclease
MDAAAAVRMFGNIATRRQLVAKGVSGGDLTTAVCLGEIRRVRRAYYATPAASADAVHAVRVGGRLAGLSAARSYGLWAGFDTRLHVSLPANASRLRTNVAPSFLADQAMESPLPLTPDTTTRHIILHWLAARSNSTECWRCSIAETLAQVATWCDRETVVACLDTSRTVLGLTDTDIAQALTVTPAQVRMLATRSRPGSDSGCESIVRQRLVLIGIEVVQQITFDGVGRVDMQIKGTNILIEVDGRAYHSDRISFENDRRRRNELVQRGYVVLQFSYKQVFEEWVWCESMIVGALSLFRSQ